MRFRPQFLVFLLAAGLFSSCSKGSEPMPAPVYLLDQQWNLTEVAGEAAVTSPSQPAPTLTLHSVGSTNAGQAYCNPYGGRYTLAAGSPELHFTIQASGRANCPSGLQETQYLTLLPRVARYVISNRHLALYDDEHATPLLVFEALR